MFRKKDSAQQMRGRRVVAAIDMPGVPAGTTGKIQMTNGFRWTRYWVLFDNGVDRGSLGEKQITFVDRQGNPINA